MSAARIATKSGLVRTSAREWRVRLLAAGALILTVGIWIVGYGLIDLIDGFTGFVDQSRNQVLDAGWGAIFGIVLPLALLAQVHRATRRIAALQQIGVVLVALTAATVAATDWRYLSMIAVLGAVLAIMLVLHPERRAFLRRGRPLKPQLALLGGIAAIPCLLGALDSTSARRHGLGPIDAQTHGFHHWTVMTALALVVPLLILLAALGTNGWRLPAWSASAAAAIWGIATLAGPGPTTAGSYGSFWACCALAWAAAVAAITQLERRRERQTVQEHPPSRPRSAMSRRPHRSAFAVAGALAVVRGGIGYAHPAYWEPTTSLDWAAVITFSALLAALAAAMLVVANDQRGIMRWPFVLGAVGAALASVANALEDGIGLSRFGYPFAAGTALMVVSLLAGGVVLLIFRAGSRRLGLLFLVDVAALAIAFDDTGLVILGSTWLLLAGGGHGWSRNDVRRSDLEERTASGSTPGQQVHATAPT